MSETESGPQTTAAKLVDIKIAGRKADAAQDRLEHVLTDIELKQSLEGLKQKGKKES